MARRPKPTALKVVTGNPGKRRLPAAEPRPALGLPAPPDHLGAVARKLWRDLGPMLERLGIVGETDVIAFEGLCEAFADFRAASEIVDRDGRVYLAGVLVKANPACAMKAEADRRLRSYMTEFGLTPASRATITANAPPVRGARGAAPPPGEDPEISAFFTLGVPKR